MSMPLESYQRIDIILSTRFFICCFLFLGFCILACGICQASAPPFNAKVIRIIDGDTLEIQRERKIQRVRIWGIDTPEWDQPYASRAQKFTRSLLAGREVEIRPMDFDVYGRLVAMITVDEKNISEELVESGLAWVYINFCNEPICTAWQSLQERAMSRRIGLWSDRHPIAPWQWKRKHFR
jgi:micrococcal nuclease